ncbi:hypothetical protein CLOM_g24014 [Closterium sp. NIES-68]|nr:hypothetical protein CLOM_g24014 [Closterium sp. NIES-68]GJP80962.1 hypothetical protein CLOP_g11153 [Closterium sp. NIES-67]
MDAVRWAQRVALATWITVVSVAASYAAAEPTAVYIVQLRDLPPISAYRGGIAGFPATAPPVATTTAAAAAAVKATARTLGLRNMRGPLRRWFRRRHPNIRLPHVKAFAELLGKAQKAIAEKAGILPNSMLYSYTYLSNGFAAKLTPAQANQLRKDSAVAEVRQSLPVRPAGQVSSPAGASSSAAGGTTPTAAGTGTVAGKPAAGGAGGAKTGSVQQGGLKMPQELWVANGGELSAGEDVVVGVIDSGIWPEHPSFSDTNSSNAYGPPPSTWQGKCDTTEDFPACNDKVIGARFFINSFDQSGRQLNTARDFRSPRDVDGHGSWCAGAAAGNSNVPVMSSSGKRFGTVSGMAPRARIAVYKAFWLQKDGSLIAEQADIEAAVNQAVADGVDVLSMSFVSDVQTSYFDDRIFLRANQVGVVPVLAAGNSGPPPGDSTYRTLYNYSPFYLTVGASTLAQRYQTQITLGNKAVVLGAGLGGNAVTAKGAPLIDARSAPGEVAGLDEAELCFPGCLDPAKVAGKIVMCLRGGVFLFEKAHVVAEAGGVGVIFVNDPTGSSDVYSSVSSATIPTVHLTATQGATIRAYIKKTKQPTATIGADCVSAKTTVSPPAVAAFSSTGPPLDPMDDFVPFGPTNDILKPDILSPGVELWSAVAGDIKNASKPVFDLLSGTSMATPLAAGIAALLVQRFPTWTPAQVMSAIQTTASPVNDAGKPITTEKGAVATPWETGAGTVNAAKLADPGLTYNAGIQEYMNFLAGQSRYRTGVLWPKEVVTPTPAYNLNLPAIVFSRVNGTRVAVRTVTSVAAKASTYKAKVVVPLGMQVTVTPSQFSVKPGESRTFTVAVSILKPSTKFAFGSLTWEDELGHSVRSVLAVQSRTMFKRK